MEEEQSGKKRAEYGKQLLAHLGKRLTEKYGSGFGVRSLRRMRQFYLVYPNGSGLTADVSEKEKRSAVLTESQLSQLAFFPPTLSWTHYLALIRVSNPDARAFYEIEAARENWGTRELERQIASLLYERLAKSRNKDKVLALAKEGQQVSTPEDIIKDPTVLEFLNLKERPEWHERDLEQAMIDRIEEVLFEH